MKKSNCIYKQEKKATQSKRAVAIEASKLRMKEASEAMKAGELVQYWHINLLTGHEYSARNSTYLYYQGIAPGYVLPKSSFIEGKVWKLPVKKGSTFGYITVKVWDEDEKKFVGWKVIHIDCIDYDGADKVQWIKNKLYWSDDTDIPF